MLLLLLFIKGKSGAQGAVPKWSAISHQ